MYMIIKEGEEEEEENRIHPGLGQRLSWDPSLLINSIHTAPLSSPHIPMSLGLDEDCMCAYSIRH